MRNGQWRLLPHVVSFISEPQRDHSPTNTTARRRAGLVFDDVTPLEDVAMGASVLRQQRSRRPDQELGSRRAACQRIGDELRRYTDRQDGLVKNRHGSPPSYRRRRVAPRSLTVAAAPHPTTQSISTGARARSLRQPSVARPDPLRPGSPHRRRAPVLSRPSALHTDPSRNPRAGHARWRPDPPW